MLKEIILSVQAYFKAHQFIKENKLWKWIILPGILYAVLFIFSIYLFWQTSSHATAWILHKYAVVNWLNKINVSWINFLLIVTQIFINFLLLLFYFSFFKYLFLIIGSPLFAYLSEKTSSSLTGNKIEFSLGQWMKDILRGIQITGRNMFWQFIYMIALIFVSFIPIAGWITPVVLFFIDCYYMGFSMLDYSHERENVSASKSIYVIGHHKGLAIGNGMVFYLMHLIPLAGWIFAPGYAVIAATVTLHEAQEKKLIVY